MQILARVDGAKHEAYREGKKGQEGTRVEPACRIEKMKRKFPFWSGKHVVVPKGCRNVVEASQYGDDGCEACGGVQPRRYGKSLPTQSRHQKSVRRSELTKRDSIHGSFLLMSIHSPKHVSTREKRDEQNNDNRVLG